MVAVFRIFGRQAIGVIALIVLLTLIVWSGRLSAPSEKPKVILPKPKPLDSSTCVCPPTTSPPVFCPPVAPQPFPPVPRCPPVEKCVCPPVPADSSCPPKQPPAQEPKSVPPLSPTSSAPPPSASDPKSVLNGQTIGAHRFLSKNEFFVFRPSFVSLTRSDRFRSRTNPN